MKFKVINVAPMGTPRPRFKTQLIVKVVKGKKKQIPIPKPYSPEEYIMYKDLLIRHIKDMKLEPIPKGVPVLINYIFYFKYPESTAKKRLIENYPHVIKPDEDNVYKGLLDALVQAGVLADDKQVIGGDFRRKLYTTSSSKILFNIEKYTKHENISSN